jgi:hypothetical protein
VGAIRLLRRRVRGPDGLRVDNGADAPHDKRLRADKAIAQSYWGAVCNGQVSIVRAPLDGKAGQAQYMDPPGNVPNENCVIVINSNRYFDDETLCAIEVHEFGHLKGLNHSKNKRSVMYPRITKKNIPPLCK